MLAGWVFNIIFAIYIFMIAYGKANIDTLPEDCVESATWFFVIFMVILPLAVFFIMGGW